MILAGDIGGTKTNLAFFSPKDCYTPKNLKTYSSKENPSLEAIVADYLKKFPEKVDRACFGIAGPVINHRCEATNLPWVIDAKVLSKKIKGKPVWLLNDLESNAWGIQVLKKTDFHVLHAGDAKAGGNRAVIAAGTGLGEAMIYWDGKQYHAFGIEGGHADLAVRNDLEIELLKFLLAKWPQHVSCERVLAGPGFKNVYDFLKSTGRFGEEPAWLTEEFTKTDPSAAITKAGLAGKSGLCAKTLDLFVSIYGAEAGNLALKAMATGGLYIGGGIAPKIIAKLKDGAFMQAFFAKGRFNTFLKKIPVKVILNDKTALLGAAHYAATRK